MIHYITSTGVGNAWVGNELMALSVRGIPFHLHSLHKPAATFFKSDHVKQIAEQTNYIYPLSIWRIVTSLLMAPFIFPRYFFPALWNSFFGRKESFSIRIKSIVHFCVACSWARSLRKQQVSHIHSQWINSCGTVGMYAAWLLNKPFSFTGHAADLFRERCSLKDKIKRSQFIVCISSFHRGFYLSEGADPRQLIISFCGIDTAMFSPRKASSPSSEGASKAPVRLLSSARLVDKKGLKYLISACKNLEQQGVDFTCTIAGDGPLLNELEYQIQQLNLGSRVTLTGRPILQEDIPNFMRSGDIYCLPCVWADDGDVDGLPQMLMEAMACGVPVVSTKLVGIPDLIVDGETGLLAEPNNSDDLADKLQQLIDNDALQGRLSQNGRQQVERFFDLSTCLNPLFEKFTGSIQDNSHNTDNVNKTNAKGISQ
ncbi:MAG: glycosyltransferase [Porticoccaceae bacterium]|nr:glycosyltransferase [Porticoccaceae bacterium]